MPSQAVEQVAIRYIAEATQFLKMSKTIQAEMARIAKKADESGKAVDKSFNQLARSQAQVATAQAKVIDSMSKGMKVHSNSASAIQSHADSYYSLEKQLAFTAARLVGVYASVEMVKKVLSTGIDFNAFVESSTTAFAVMMKSVDGAKKQMQDLYDFAVKSPLTFKETVAASKQLMAYGFEAGQLVETMKTLGTVAKAVGISLDDMSYIYGTLKSQGRAYTRDLMQFAQRGIPIYDELSKVMGVTKQEIKKMTEEGSVGFEEVEKAFINMTTGGGKFAGFMDEYMNTFSGKASMLSDLWERAAGVLTEGVFAELKNGVDGLIKTMEDPAFTAVMKDIGKDLGGMAKAVAELVAGIVQALPQIVSLAKAFAALVAIKLVVGLFAQLPLSIMGVADSLMLLRPMLIGASVGATTLSGALTILAGRISFLGALALSSPLAPIILAVAALTAGILLLNKAISDMDAKGLADIEGRFKDVSAAIDIPAKKIRDIESSFQSVKVPLGGVVSKFDDMATNVDMVAKQTGLTRDKVIELALASSRVSDEYKVQLKLLRDQAAAVVAINNKGSMSQMWSGAKQTDASFYAGKMGVDEKVLGDLENRVKGSIKFGQPNLELGATYGGEFVTEFTKKLQEGIDLKKLWEKSATGGISDDFMKQTYGDALAQIRAVQEEMKSSGKITNVGTLGLTGMENDWEIWQKLAAAATEYERLIGAIGGKAKEALKLPDAPDITAWDEWAVILRDAEAFSQQTDFWKTYNKGTADASMRTKEQYNLYVKYAKDKSDIDTKAAQYVDNIAKDGTKYIADLQEKHTKATGNDKIAIAEEIEEAQERLYGRLSSAEVALAKDTAMQKFAIEKQYYEDVKQLELKRLNEVGKKALEGDQAAVQEKYGAMIGQGVEMMQKGQAGGFATMAGGLAGQATKDTEVGQMMAGGDPLTMAAKAAIDFAMSIENVQKVLNPFKTILEASRDILEPVINGMLQPFVQVLEEIGRFLGNVLRPLFQFLQIIHSITYLALAPLMAILDVVGAAFTWLSDNVIVPVGNAIIDFINGIFTTIKKWTLGIIDIPLLPRLKNSVEALTDFTEVLEKKSRLIGNTLSWLSNKLKEEMSKQRQSWLDLWEVGAITTTKYQQEISEINKYELATMDEMLIVSQDSLKTLGGIAQLITDLKVKQAEIDAELKKPEKERIDIAIDTSGIVTAVAGIGSQFDPITTAMGKQSTAIEKLIEQMMKTGGGTTTEIVDRGGTGGASSGGGTSVVPPPPSPPVNPNQAEIDKLQASVSKIYTFKIMGTTITAEAQKQAVRDRIIALGGIPAFASGTSNVPKDMSANIHKGEGIVPSDFMSAVRKGDISISGPRGTGQEHSGGDIYVSVNVEGNVTAEQDLAKSISAQIYKQTRRGQI